MCRRSFFLLIAVFFSTGAALQGGSSTPQGHRPAFDELQAWFDFYFPFSKSSPWKTKIPPGTTYSDPQAGFSSLPLGISSWGSAQTTGIARAVTDDPLVPILYNADNNSKILSGEWKRSNNPPDVEAVILAGASSQFGVLPGPGHFPCNFYSTQTPGKSWWQAGGCPDPSDYKALAQTAPLPKRAYVPVNFISGDGTDALAAILQPDGTWLDCIHAIVLSNGQGIVCEMYSFVDGTSDGSAVENGRRASMVPSFAGIVRGQEAAANNIRHALVMSGPNALLRACFTKVALAFDAQSSGYAGQSCMGERFAIPRSVTVTALCENSLCVCDFAETCALAHALQDYGVVLADRGGAGLTIHTETVAAMKQAGASEKWLTPNPQVFSRMEILVRNLKIVS